jgi:Cytidylate kinase-like family/BON domain
MNIVTFSRLVGSYGDEIAANVAEKMGLEFVGRNGLHELALSCDLEYKDACVLYETEHGPGFFERLFFDGPAHRSTFEALAFEQASRGNVVMVGRGAQIVLHNVPGVFSVGIVAPSETRVTRIMQRDNLSREGAEDFVERYDRELERLIRAVFDTDPMKWSLYDLMINTAHFTLERAVDVVVCAIEKRDRLPDEESGRETLKSMALAKRVEALIRKKLTSAVARNVEVSGEPGGTVRISGRIREKADKAKVEKIAAAYPGVTRVENDVKVTELSFGV